LNDGCGIGSSCGSREALILEHFTLEIVACGGQSPPAPISLRGFAGKPAQVGLYNFKVKML
jgi:hypothetical protein